MNAGILIQQCKKHINLIHVYDIWNPHRNVIRIPKLNDNYVSFHTGGDTLFFPWMSVHWSVNLLQIWVCCITLRHLEGFSDNFTTLRRCAEPNSQWLWLKVRVSPWAQHNIIIVFCLAPYTGGTQTFFCVKNIWLVG